ncbi:CHC2 zinc finger domain-containing protein [Trichlorobacter lovleyi]|uniref:CHC2 zinc finger domain-containing protein n=1 Tax=Trichlorobacter lovleyi TaxID=313985 RepID=UPI00223F98DB|nr:CHC2 zinc finger domain-containing protein [Trichlorobacter lovleyi]
MWFLQTPRTVEHIDGEVEVIWPTPPNTDTRGFQQLLERAKEMDVPLKAAAQARRGFVADRIYRLEQLLWGCEREAERLGMNPNFLHNQGEIRRFMKQITLLQKFEKLFREHRNLSSELEEIDDYLAGKEKKESTLIPDHQIERADNAGRDVLKQILEDAGFQVFGNWTLRCPFHDDQGPSASIAKGFLNCFAGCKAMGPIQLVRHLHGLDFPHAVKYVLRYC